MAENNLAMITLAYLDPGTAHIPLSVRTVKVSSEEVSKYSCISYIGSGDSKEILRDGRPFSIDSVLADALEALRSPDAETVWWAEGIDHAGEQEHSSADEVKNAYLNADSVRLWIGKGDSQTVKAIQLLRELAEQWRVLASALNLPENLARATPQQFLNVPQKIQQLVATEAVAFNGIKDTAIVESANAVASSPYFRHVKAITAIVLAKQAIVTTKEASLSWVDYGDSLDMIGYSGGTLPVKCDIVHLTHVSDIKIAARRLREHNHLELLPMVQSTRQRECADVRDRIFSLLPITAPSKRVDSGAGILQPPLRTDYSASQQQVFTDAARYIIGERQDLLVWNAIPALSTPSRLSGLPSWVPDWSDSSNVSTLKLRPTMGLRLWEGSPCVQCVQKPLEITASNTLKAQAHIFSRVTRVAEHRATETNFHHTALENLQPLPPSELLHGRDDYPRTLILDQWHTGVRPPASLTKRWTSFAAKMQMLKTFNVSPEEFAADPTILARSVLGEPSLAAQHVYQMAATTATEGIEQAMTQALDRRFFVLESGHLGMSFCEGEGWDEEHRICVGDVVAVFVGGYFPYVLRECGTGEDGIARCRLLGEVHVQGLMEGEALKDKGWFIDSWRDVDVCDVEIV